MYSLEDIIEEKAEKDGRYAIAHALLCINERLKEIGMGRPMQGYPGALEMIGMSLEKIGKALEDFAVTR